MSSFTSANRVLALFFGLWVSFSFGLLAISCAADQETAPLQIAEGDQALGRAEMSQAAASYRAAVRLAPDNARAAFGYGLTRLLLLPDSEAVRAIAQVTGGAQTSLESEIYGPQGALARLAGGQAPEEVLRRLAAASPWGEERLDSAVAFLAGLPEGVSASDLGWALAGLATELNDIASWFEGAAADPAFLFVLPGSALHLAHDLTLGPADARLVAGLLRLGQGLALAAAGVAEEDEPLRLSGLSPAALARTLNERFAASRPLPGRLEEARFALDLGLRELQHALEQGHAAGAAACAGGCGQTIPLVRWDLVAPAESAGLVLLLQSLRQALHAPAALPHSAPATVLVLERIFIAPYWPTAGLNEPLQADEQGGLVLRPSFLEALLRPLSSPAIQRDETQRWTLPHLTISGAPARTLLDRWTAPLRQTVAQDLGL